MVRKLSLLLSVISLMACDPFRKAERRIDNPNGKTSNEQGVQASVQKGSQQSNSSSIIDNTTGSLALPFESFAPRTGLDELLADPVLRAKVPYAKTITNLTHLAMAKSATPYALVTSDAGIIDVATETGGACSGTIDFSIAIDLDGLGLRGDVEVTMTFNQVICPEDGSIDGDVAFKASFNTLAGELKIINLIEATVSDNVQTQDIDFAFRLEAVAFSNLSLDMSVAVDDEFYTLSIDGDLASGTAVMTVKGKDGEINCTATDNSVACDGFAAFTL